MKHAIIENIPANPQAIFDLALSKSFKNWVDEKGTKNNPSHFQRKTSHLSYDQAFKIIQENKPHWVISFRNQSHLNSNEKDYWEFGGCNISSNDYGTVFIWIHLDIKEAEQIFKKFDLRVKSY